MAVKRFTLRAIEHEWGKALEMARTVNDHYSMWEEQQKLVFEMCLTIPAGGVLVELGVAYGKTSVIMAYAAKLARAHFHAVDNFSLVGSAQEYRQRLTQMRLPFILHEGKTQEVAWNVPIDLLLIDAGHDEVNIKADCERWIPWINPGGYACFHDYEPGPFDRNHAHWAVRYYADTYTGEWEDIAQVKQLKVRRKPQV